MEYKNIILSVALVSTTTLSAGWMDSLSEGFKTVQESGIMDSKETTSEKSSGKSSNIIGTDLSSLDMNSALKKALNSGVTYALGALGKDNGYFNNTATKIELPQNMQKMAEMVKKFGGEKYVDDLVLSLNNAATEAAPKTAKIFAKSISNMSIDDAKKILSGSKTAATDYFRSTTTKDLTKTIAPIIQKSMDNNDVAKYYNSFNSFYKENAGALKNEYVSGAANFLGYGGLIPSEKEEDINAFVTNRSIDGIMVMIEEKEALIRDNPILGNSKIVEKVFSVFK